MWLTTLVFAALLLLPPFVRESVEEAGDADPTSATKSLCIEGEQIIFSCQLKRATKIVSLCASADLAKERGYLQYRFGLPGKIELQFPQDRQRPQQNFHYAHYFRYQVDMTEIGFRIDGHQYSIFDEYNGEEKPSRTDQGVSVTAPGKDQPVKLVCDGKATADYSLLSEVLPVEEK